MARTAAKVDNTLVLDDESLLQSVTDNTTAMFRHGDPVTGRQWRPLRDLPLRRSAEALELTMMLAEETHAARLLTWRDVQTGLECNIPAIYGGLTLVCDH